MSRTPLQIAGVDLAWGERNGDGLCLLRAHDATGGTGCRAEVVESAHVFGDGALLDWIETRLPASAGPSLLLFDAPLVCPNATGSRPVDRLTTSRFGRFHAGPHPANATRCGRPLRLARALEARGGVIGWELGTAQRLLAEVFPHPATIRLLGLERIVKYKRGPVAARRGEFARLQGLLRGCLRTRFAPGEWVETPALAAVLSAPWTKPAEDRLDALICALIGYHHWRYSGRRSEVLGDLETGFILLPGAERMKDEAGRQRRRSAVTFLPLPSSFILHPSSFCPAWMQTFAAVMSPPPTSSRTVGVSFA